MRALIAALLLGGAFGTASAAVESIESGVMTIDIEVEIGVTAQSVVAHLVFDNDEALTLPLLDRGDGVFGIVTQLEAKNYMVVFEILGPNGEISEPVSLTMLGADLRTESTGTTDAEEDDGLSVDSRRLLWLAVALGAGSLSVLAIWVLGDRDKPEEDEEGTDATSDDSDG
ncbi:MAG TPA: hypothetical protein VGB33_05600 [Acidimicrobiia bacterium]|jgi:hypothetical protein